MEPTFPLFRLPENAIVHVLERMDFNQVFFISLISLRTKSLVTSLDIKARDVFIKVTSCIGMNVHTTKSNLTLIFYDDTSDHDAALPIDITLPVAAYFFNEGTTIQSSTPFNFSNWLNHIQSVFCFTKPLNLDFYRGAERFEVQSLKNTIGTVDILYVAREVTDVYSKEVLKHFTAPNELNLEKNPFDETCQIQKIFIKNFKTIQFDDVYSLDDMLLVNSEKVKFWRPTTHKQFNKFLKHWIRGSNPRLQCMDLAIDDSNSMSRDILLKGIRCVDVAEEIQLEICEEHIIESDYMVEIRREDGTPAIIAAEDIDDILFISFFVYY